MRDRLAQPPHLNIHDRLKIKGKQKYRYKTGNIRETPSARECPTVHGEQTTSCLEAKWHPNGNAQDYGDVLTLWMYVCISCSLFSYDEYMAHDTFTNALDVLICGFYFYKKNHNF